jgi:hypothetical protein
MGPEGVLQDRLVEPGAVVRAEHVHPGVRERDVDQRFVLGAGRVLLVRTTGPDRLPDDPDPPPRVLLGEGPQHRADDAAGVAPGDRHVREPDPPGVVAEAVADQFQVAARDGDEYRLVPAQPAVHEIQETAEIARVVVVEETVVAQSTVLGDRRCSR